MRRTSSLLLTLVWAAALHAATPVSSWDIAIRTRSASDAAISPDGSQIAYVLSIPRNPFEQENGPSWAELHIVDHSGNSRPYVAGEQTVSNIAWTPDGRSVSFLSKRGKDEHRSLYVIEMRGGEARRIVSHEEDISEYSWSPDGKRLAFLATEPVAKEKKDLEKKGFNQEVYEESARPVRIWIAFAEGKDKPRKLEVEGSASELNWSPVGSWLAVALAPTSLVDDSYMKRRVHVIDAETGRIVARFDNPGKLGNVRWSPDGKRIAFISAADLHDPSAGRLVVVSASGGPIRDLLPGYEGNVNDVIWRDSNTLLYLGDVGVWTTIGALGADGSGHRVVLPAGQASIGSFDVGGGAAALIADSPSHPSEVFVWTEGSAPRRLTNSNPWLESRSLASQEVVRFRARDGLELEGILIRPLNERRGQRYPLILTVHGGPEAHHRNGWLTSYASPGQMAAARGFAVFFTNYRGSTGRGVAFSKLSQGEPAGKEFDDLVDAVDHLVNIGLVDRGKVGITGGSYGGYATAWGSTYYSDRFAAGVMFVGISDKVSKWGETDIPEEEHLVHALKYPFENWQFFLERSPVYHAGKSNTPLLILHGKDDPRVHPSQSMELYRHLKTRSRAPVRLIFYPGEQHGNRKAAARLDSSLRQMRWFEHYLKGPGGAAPPFEIDYPRQPEPGPTAEEEKKEKPVEQEPAKKEELRKKDQPAKP